jgi:hypothetical protein
VYHLHIATEELCFKGKIYGLFLIQHREKKLSERERERERDQEGVSKKKKKKAVNKSIKSV